MSRKQKQWAFDFKKYRQLLKRGLSNGVCNFSTRQVCIEAAVSIALGESKDPIDLETDDAGMCEEPSDAPSCVDHVVAGLKIALNDASGWKSAASRAKGLRVLGVAQLGTNTKKFNRSKFNDIFEDLIAQRVWPLYLKGLNVHKDVIDFYASGRYKNPSYLEELALETVESDNWEFPTDYSDRFEDFTEKQLLVAVDCMIEALRKMKSPGIKLLKKL